MRKILAVIVAVMLSAGCVYGEDLASLKAKAEHGDAEAMNRIGVLYHNGDGVKRDYREALKWYTKASELGSAKAYDNMGWMYQNAQGVEKDMAKALELYRKGAEGGISRSLNQIGWFYENGYGGLDEDYDKAAEYYLKAAEKGNKSSQYHLGMYYSNVKHDEVEALKWLEKAAQQDHVVALRIAGNMYKNGRGSEIDYKKAFDYYTRAIELENDSYSQVALAHMYWRGFYVKKNLKRAFTLNQKAAEQGNVRGQCNVGYMYGTGTGVRKDLKLARQWLEKAAHNDSNWDGARDDAIDLLKELPKR